MQVLDLLNIKPSTSWIQTDNVPILNTTSTGVYEQRQVGKLKNKSENQMEHLLCESPTEQPRTDSYWPRTAALPSHLTQQ